MVGAVSSLQESCTYGEHEKDKPIYNSVTVFTQGKNLSLSSALQPPQGRWTAVSRPGSRLMKGTARLRQASLAEQTHA